MTATSLSPLYPIRDPLRYVRSSPPPLSSSSLAPSPPLPPPAQPPSVVPSSAPRVIQPDARSTGAQSRKAAFVPTSQRPTAFTPGALLTPIVTGPKRRLTSRVHSRRRPFLLCGGGLAQSSASTYAAGPLRFTQFCDTHGISEEARMLASHRLVIAFVSQHIAKSARSLRACGPGTCTTMPHGWATTTGSSSAVLLRINRALCTSALRVSRFPSTTSSRCSALSACPTRCTRRYGRWR